MKAGDLDGNENGREGTQKNTKTEYGSGGGLFPVPARWRYVPWSHSCREYNTVATYCKVEVFKMPGGSAGVFNWFGRS